MPLIYLIAGEASGDAIGARLMAALSAKRPNLSFAGIGGPLMEAQGMTSLFPMRELALMGLVEVLPKLRHIQRRLAETVADIAARQPAVVVTIDSPGFATRVLKQVAELGIARAHYVAPQAWAWRESRVRKYPGLWDRLLCLLPFEPAFFERHGLAATFVGHPVLESGADRGDAARFRAAHSIPPDATVLTLMPGSRAGEVSRLLPVLGAALDLLRARIPGLVPVVAAAAPVAATVARTAKEWPARPIILTGAQDKYDAFAASAAAITKSGTSTLELAMAGVPMIVTYRVNPITAEIGRRIIKIKYASILNLLSDREVVPELLQERSNPTLLAESLHRLLTDPEAIAAQRRDCAAVLRALSPPHGRPSEAAADEVLGLFHEA